MIFFKGFTLAELLVTLLILGEIATFTIPKILSSQQQARNNAVAKETAAAIAEAYYLYKLEHTVNQSTLALTFLDDKLNYVRRGIATADVIDAPPNGPTITRQCSSVNPCYYLHNGGILRPANCAFGGTSALSAVYLMFDMDGVIKNTMDSVEFVVYFSGRVTSTGQVEDGTVSGGGCTVPRSPDPLADPAWFSW